MLDVLQTSSVLCNEPDETGKVGIILILQSRNKKLGEVRRLVNDQIDGIVTESGPDSRFATLLGLLTRAK